MTHSVAGARGTVGNRDQVLRQAQEWAATRGSEAFLADAAAVFGRDHLESAALHAERARATGTMVTRSVSMEALLYLSGHRQVADAIRAAGLTEKTAAAAVMVFGDAPAGELVTYLGWDRDDSVLDAPGKDLGILGISGAERGTVSQGRVLDLALERTALVDVHK